MRVNLYDNPIQFSEAVSPFLAGREVENCVLLGRISEALAAWPGTGRHEALPLMVSAHSGGRVVAAATMDPPHSLVLSDATSDATEAVVGQLKAAGTALPGVTAPEPTASDLAAAWCAASGQSSRLEVALRLFELRQVIVPAAVGGAFQRAQPHHAETLASWAECFFRDVGDARDRHYCRAEVCRRTGAGRLFVWCDPEPVSMAGWAGPTPHGARVNFVYTPPEHRGRGYASACVASLSQHLLDSGRQFCCLFTDVSNPTSNRIYQAIGYTPVRDFSRHTFFGRNER